MEWGFSFVDVAQGVLIALASLLGAIGLRKGYTNPKPVEVATEVAGALVDNSSVHKLAGAVQEYTTEVHATRQALHRMNHNIEELGDQMKELRSTLQRLGDILLSRK